jgi:GNAT superfamily N-acetyltransferase
VVQGFRCGSRELDEWLARYALVNQRAGMATVFVTTVGDAVVGYYALSTGGVEHAVAPQRVKRGVARHPIPVVILTRLAVHENYQGRGLGSALLRDALRRVAAAADEIGIRALLVHAKDEEARAFYLDFGEFEPSPTGPLHLFLLLKDLRAALAE